MYPHWQVPISTASIYGGILWSPLLYPVVAAVTTIIVSLIFFRKRCKTRNKCQERGILKQGHPAVTLFQGSSNFKISNTNINAIGGNATIIRFGDGQFTEIQRNLICDYIANLTVLPDINDTLKKHVLTQSIITLPRAEAVFNDYQAKKKSGPCFERTRVALLREMADWATGQGESKMYVLSGLAGIGKSTVAYTIASRAADLNLLGASFFCSRDEADRNNAKKFFCTMAYQLCVYDEAFSKAIGDVLLTERGSAATTKDPHEQLKVLILDPLRSIVQSRARPILVVVDALDECDEDDEHAVVMGLSQLVRLLPSFKVILTTRPQPLANYLFCNHDGHEIFYLQDIEDMVVDGDIRLYLSHSLSLEQVRARLLNAKGKWCASGEDIESLVKVAGRLFIIASIAVLYVLNKALGDPGARMKKLLGEIAQDRTPFHTLNHFYFIIVRSAVQVDNDDDGDDDIVDRYQIIVGTIVVIQTPLPVTTLACFVGDEPENIYAMLRNLQSVILLGNDDIPRIYHKSFPDYLTDPARCKDSRLRIDTRIRHTQIATRCFEIMDRHLKYNILGLGDQARFMSNEDVLKEDGITDEQLQERIPHQLRYACVYWVNHLEVANVEDADLLCGLTKFADKQMLHWFEVLSLIGKLDSAHRAIGVVLKLLKFTSSDLPQLLSDALRFISKFYEVIERSGLHTYYSALPFTPTESHLYRRYIKEMVHKICSIEGGTEKWDALIAHLSHGKGVTDIKFSLDSTLFASCSEEDKNDPKGEPGQLKIWDAVTGTPISTIPGHRFAIANDLSSVASSADNIITYYNVNGSAQSTMLPTSSKIRKLALSSESNRVVAALSDGTVWLWESRNAKLINSFDDFDGNPYLQIKFSPQLQFSATGTRIAYSSGVGIVKLRDGISGRFIADMQCGSSPRFVFSGDGSRIASLSSACGLMLWNSESGGLIGAVRDSDGADWRHFAISADGSLLATSDRGQATLWSGNNDSLRLALIDVLEHGFSGLMAFSLDHTVAIAASHGIMKFYGLKTHSFISTVFFGENFPTALAFSPNCTRFSFGAVDGRVYLWDFRGIDASSSPSKEATHHDVTALALSRDCSQLACGFGDGTVQLWETSPTKRRIASHHAHKEPIGALGYGPDDALFASVSDDGTIKLWNGEDGSLVGTLEAVKGLRAVAFSNSVLVVGGNYDVTLWGLDTLSLIHTFKNSKDSAHRLSISQDSALIAVFYRFSGVSLLDAVNYTTIATFDVPYLIDIISFLPDNSHLVVQSRDGAFLSYSLINKVFTKGPRFEHLIQLPNTLLWHGIPVWHCRDKEHHCLSALFPQHKSPVPVLWIPMDLRVTVWTQKSSMTALGCKDGRVVLIRLPTSRVTAPNRHWATLAPAL